MPKFFTFNDGFRVCIDKMIITRIRPLTDPDSGGKHLYTDEEFAEILATKPAGVRRTIRSKDKKNFYHEGTIVAYSVEVVLANGSLDELSLRIDEYDRFMQAVDVQSTDKQSKIEADNKNPGPLPQTIFDFAPEWAEYAAMDADGDIYFYDDEPKLYEDDYVWERGKGKRSSRFYYSDISWRRSLTRRAE